MAKFTTAGCVLAVSVVWQSWITTPAQADDVQTITDKAIASISLPDSSTVLGYLDNLNADGSFSDLDYDGSSTSSFNANNHLTRLRQMVKAYTTSSSSLYHDESSLTKATILSVYDNWITNDYQSGNWWYNEIDTPRKLSQAMLMLKQDGSLSDSRLNSGTTIVARAYMPRSDETSTNVGQNRVWRADASLNRGLLTNKTSLISESFLAVSDALAVTTGDGIQRDRSFHQHGPLLYNGSYGMGFCQDVARIAYEGAGTAYGFSTTKVKNVVDFMLDGQQWFARGDNFDIMTQARVISRNTVADVATSLIAPTAYTVSLSQTSASSYRLSELNALSSRLAAADETHTADPNLALSGNRQFRRSDMMVHQRPGYYTSVKTVSTRTYEPESINEENLKGLHQYDGTNLVLRTGNEYDNIQAAWDWNRLPGTTTERTSYSLQPAEDGTYGTSTYDGGVSDGSYGLTAFKYNRRNVSAQKGWFFFDNEYVALGSNIDTPDATALVATSVNQTLQKGKVTYKIASGTSSLSSGTAVRKFSWVNHDSIGYFFPQATAGTITAKWQDGSWYDINHSYSSDSTGANVFSLDISHGTTSNDATYAYVVAPGLTVDEMDAYNDSMPITILRNDSLVQAVRQNTLGITEAAFYDADTLAITGGLTLEQVTSGVGSLIMFDESSAGLLTLTVASPEALSGTLEYRININLTGEDAVWSEEYGYTTIQFTLPDGDLAGLKVSGTFAIIPEPAAGALLLIAAATSLLLRSWRRTEI